MSRMYESPSVPLQGIGVNNIGGGFRMLRSASGSNHKNRFANVFIGRKLKYYCIS